MLNNDISCYFNGYAMMVPTILNRFVSVWINKRIVELILPFKLFKWQ